MLLKHGYMIITQELLVAIAYICPSNIFRRLYITIRSLFGAPFTNMD